MSWVSGSAADWMILGKSLVPSLSFPLPQMGLGVHHKAQDRAHPLPLTPHLYLLHSKDPPSGSAPTQGQAAAVLKGPPPSHGHGPMKIKDTGAQSEMLS